MKTNSDFPKIIYKIHTADSDGYLPLELVGVHEDSEGSTYGLYVTGHSNGTTHRVYSSALNGGHVRTPIGSNYRKTKLECVKFLIDYYIDSIKLIKYRYMGNNTTSEPSNDLEKRVQLLRIMRNVETQISRNKRRTTPNWKLVELYVLIGTGTSGRTSCMEQCIWMGVDPGGYTFS